MGEIGNVGAHLSDTPRFIFAVALVCAGGAAALVGAVGVLRFPDFYTRLHAVAICHASATPLMLGGLAVAAWDAGVAVKLLLLGLLIAVIAPVASHILASAAHGSGRAPYTDVSP